MSYTGLRFFSSFEARAVNTYLFGYIPGSLKKDDDSNY